MLDLIAVLATVGATCNPLSIVAQRELARARDTWLFGVLALGTAWLAWHGHYWLAIMALWHLVTWRDESLRSSVLLWGGVGATWFFLRALPPWAFDLLPWVWLAWGAVQSVICVYTWRRLEWPTANRPTLGKRTKGTFGSPVLTAIYLAAVAPFAPWWGWVLLAPGIWFTNSWTAALGLALGAAWRSPSIALVIAIVVLAAFLLLFVSKYRERDVMGTATWWSQRVLESLPRGDSVDGWYARAMGARLLLYYWWHSDRRWLGHGPGTAPRQLMRWNSRLKDRGELLNGSCHCDVLETLYEMGLVGLAAVVAFGLPILMRLQLGDPWSAAWLVLAVVSLGHWPMRHPALGLLFLTVSARLAY